MGVDLNEGLQEEDRKDVQAEEQPGEDPDVYTWREVQGILEANDDLDDQEGSILLQEEDHTFLKGYVLEDQDNVRTFGEGIQDVLVFRRIQVSFPRIFQAFLSEGAVVVETEHPDLKTQVDSYLIHGKDLFSKPFLSSLSWFWF